jgi:hypothetical protein
MKSHHIKLALVATIRTRPNLNIPADEISSVFIPLSNELFEMIHKVLTPMFSGRFGVQRKTGPVEARQGRNVLELLVI